RCPGRSTTPARPWPTSRCAATSWWTSRLRRSGLSGARGVERRVDALLAAVPLDGAAQAQRVGDHRRLLVGAFLRPQRHRARLAGKDGERRDHELERLAARILAL